jgi:hypothetical protein
LRFTGKQLKNDLLEILALGALETRPDWFKPCSQCLFHQRLNRSGLSAISDILAGVVFLKWRMHVVCFIGNQ